MGVLHTLYKQTFIYGVATVLPRMLSFFLVRLHTDQSVLQNVSDYGDVSLIFAYFVLLNILLSYGMETALFRFYNSNVDKKIVISTSAITLFFTSIIFVGLGFVFETKIAELTTLKVSYIRLVLWILLFDSLVIIPFAYLRLKGKALRYSVIKIANVLVNLGFNVFFLVFLEDLANQITGLEFIYIPNFEVQYIFIANLIASAVCLGLMLPFYMKLQLRVDFNQLKKMLKYAFPILIAGLAFSVNEAFDRILLERILPEATAKTAVGMYSACYKLALFMMLFATAYRLGIEPFFFSQSTMPSAKKRYARVLEFFVILGALILIIVVVFIDVLKYLLIPNPAYWGALDVVPILLLAYLFLGIYHNLSVWYKVTDQTSYGAYISVFGAIITLVINIFFISKYSYKASALATLLAYASMSIVSYSLSTKHYPIPYNLRKTLMYIMVSSIFSLIYFYVFRGNYIVGLAFIFFIIGMIWHTEKDSLRLLKHKNESKDYQ